MGRKTRIREIVAAIGVILLLGGVVAAPAATVLTLYFPEVDLVPVSGGESYNWTRVWIVPPGTMNWVGVYLNYGDSMIGVYASNIRVNVYIMDVFNFFHYVQGATFFTPILKGQPSEFSPFGYTASIPGYYYLVVENYSPYPAFVIIEGTTMSTIVIPITNFEHSLFILMLYVSLICIAIGLAMYLPTRILESRKQKKKPKKAKESKKQ
ncbi:MAG: hypothetical protein Q6352_007645 [Candidatus Freyrarchaeum guaymaensis]|nr:hypothetical protein [Candidatus Sigynarchaeota archaeon]